MHTINMEATIEKLSSQFPDPDFDMFDYLCDTDTLLLRDIARYLYNKNSDGWSKPETGE